MTLRLYEQDSYCCVFSATVLSCEAADQGFNVVLDKTAFFPLGGGQAADEGTIDGIKIIDVKREGDVIIHTVEAQIPAGKEVEGKIDWELRFSRMQSHAGEHIVSGVVHSLFGYSNVGFHMSDALMTVDFDGVLTYEDIEKIELESNRAVYKNVEIVASYPAEEELKDIDYRSKIEIGEDLRLITIEGVDCCACCAPHPARTGEIGLIKIVNFYPYKKGTRVEMLAGINAMYDYMALNAANKELMGILSASRQNVNEAVIKQNEQLTALRTQNAQMSKRLALLELNPQKIGNDAYSLCENLTYDELRYCANSLQDKGTETCVLLSKADEGYIYVVASKVRDVRDIVKSLNEKFQGKGGGKPDYAQGKLSANDEDIKKAVEEILKQ